MPERRPRRRHPEQEPEDDDSLYDDGDDGADEEPPRSRRRSRSSSDDGEPRSRRRSRSRDDDGDDDERPSRSRGRGRARDDDDDPDAADYKRRSRRSRDDDDDADDDDEDTPSLESIYLVGWEGQKTAASRTGKLSDAFINLEEAGEDGVLVAFLDEAPFASYNEHWVERGKNKQKSFVCIGPDCPICKHLGDAKLSSQSLFNVVVLAEGVPPRVQIVRAKKRLGEVLAKANKSRNGPLSNGYWVLSQAGKAKDASYQVEFVKPRDLMEDWGVKELTDEEFEGLEKKAYDRTVLRVPKRSELMDIVEEFLD